MLENRTAFDTGRHHIHLEFSVTGSNGASHSVAGILDAGAPRTDFEPSWGIDALIGFLSPLSGND
ncbi:hypothetical protein [Methylomagnum sp.]